MSGNIYRLRSIKHYFESGNGSVTLAPAVKSEVILCIEIGCEPKVIRDASERCDIVAAMKELGWVIDPELPAETKSKFEAHLRGEEQ